MRRAESLSIDKRGSNSPNPILLRPSGNHLAATLPGLLMDDDGMRQLTIVTSTALAINEAILVEKPRVSPYAAESVFCTVSDCRPGQRAEDLGNIFVSHLVYRPKETRKQG